MNSRSSTYWLLAGGLALFALFTARVEIRTRAEALQRVEQHAHAVAPALWNLDRRLGADYLDLAATSFGYDRVAVLSSDGAMFLESYGPTLQGLERALARLGLLPAITLSAPILNDGQVIGSIEAVWISRSIYAEAYALLAITLLLILIDRSLQIAEGKRLLEQRVEQRTRQLAERVASHRQLTRLLDLAPDAIFVREVTGEISYWNKGAEHLFGPGDRHLIEPRLRGLYETAATADTEGKLSSTRLWVGKLEATRANGEALTLHASLSLTPDEQRNHNRVLFIATDVTARAELEEHLLRAQRTQAVGTLASGIAHDFNNLLTPILLSAQMLRLETASTPGAAATIETIEKCARRGADVVRQLLNLSGNRPAKRTTVQLPVVLNDIIQLLRGTFPKTIRLEHVWPDFLPPIEADPTNLHQAILNLCVNARDAMPEGGLLKLEARVLTLDPPRLARHPNATPGFWMTIVVSDTGVGISGAMQERIFDPFFTTKEAGQGTGLGLSTVQGIIQSHSGFVEVVSAPSRGSTFTLFLPCQVANPATPSDESSTVGIRGAGELVLVVDDESQVLKSTTHLLKGYGYRTLAAGSGQEALKLHAERGSEINAVVTDLMMPGLDGLGLAEALRRRAPALPIIVMTGLLTGQTRQRINAAGLTSILAKPFRTEDLLAQLRAALNGRG